MGLIRPSVLLLATLLSAPAIYRFAVGDLDVTAALTRYLVAVAIAAVMLAGLRLVTSGYGKPADSPPLLLGGPQPGGADGQPEPEPATA